MKNVLLSMALLLAGCGLFGPSDPNISMTIIYNPKGYEVKAAIISTVDTTVAGVQFNFIDTIADDDTIEIRVPNRALVCAEYSVCDINGWGDRAKSTYASPGLVWFIQ